jgi:hypothetical protein
VTGFRLFFGSGPVAPQLLAQAFSHPPKDLNHAPGLEHHGLKPDRFAARSVILVDTGEHGGNEVLLDLVPQDNALATVAFEVEGPLKEFRFYRVAAFV